MNPQKASKPIDEKIQAPIRKRLEILRKTRKIMMSQMTEFSSSTIKKYESHDISSMSLGFAFQLAGRFGLNPKDFFDYLLSDDEVVFFKHEATRNTEAISSYMRELSAEDQALCVDIVRLMVEHHHLKLQSRDIDDTVKRIRRNSKEILQQAKTLAADT